MGKLLRYHEQHCKPLAGLLLTMWRALRECASWIPPEVPEWRIAYAQAELTALNEDLRRRRRGLPQSECSPRPEESEAIYHCDLIVTVNRMLEQLDVAF